MAEKEGRKSVLRGWSALVGRAGASAIHAVFPARGPVLDDDATDPPPPYVAPVDPTDLDILKSPDTAPVQLENATLHDEDAAMALESLLDSPATEVGAVPGLAAALAEPPPAA